MLKWEDVSKLNLERVDELIKEEKMKNKKYEITDAELEIMNILWEENPLTLNEIVERLSKKEVKNKSTIKT